uniref:Uncharacterized protein n=1 Tax=Anguilla anguilla TaxID=7936 RepID=A0A0E9TDF3_ANGAN
MVHRPTVIGFPFP